MRHTRLLLPVLLALTVAACMHQQPGYYVTDSMTGQRVAAGQQSTAGNEQRGFFSSKVPQASAVRSYASAQPQSQPSAERGLFNSGQFKGRSRATAYAYPAQQPYPPQTYAYRPPQQAYARQPAPTQYRPYQPVPQAYAQYPYRQPPPTGYYAERYGWY